MGYIKYEDMEMLPPRSDVVFKALLGTEKTKVYLMKLINAILKINIAKPEDITFLNTENSPEYTSDKLTRMDLKVKVDEMYINIEIQVLNTKETIERAIYYLTKLVTGQIKKGHSYSRLQKSVSIMIVNYIFLENEVNYINQYRLKNRETNNELTDLLELNFIELPKMICNKEVDEMSQLELWTTFLAADDEQTIKRLENNEMMKPIIEHLKYISEKDEKIRAEYEAREDAIRDYESGMISVRDHYLEQGLQQGRLDEKYGIAKEMLLKGIGLDLIAEITKLNKEDILKLQQ